MSLVAEIAFAPLIQNALKSSFSICQHPLEAACLSATANTAKTRVCADLKHMNGSHKAGRFSA